MAEQNWEGLPKKEGRGWRVYVLGIAIFLFVILIAQNSQKVTVDFLFVDTETPLIVALLIAGALGALIGWALPHVRRSRRLEREREQQRD
ncbi:MAG: Lipopolysaccharide assembly protein domain [Solirubrobacterales bacterium]|nr:Lipopolysaccharide assembly protein domain [Solirubrobacterales bacterium]